MYRDTIKNTVIINRAVPGSGKTTISKCIIKFLEKKGETAIIYSADDFFITKEGAYNFDIIKLNENHHANLSRFINSLEKGHQIVICDNINIAPWQTKPYTDKARTFGYKILFITFSPRGLDKHIQSQIVTPGKPDAHGVPKETLVRFISEYNNYTPLLSTKNKIDPKIHKNYYWDTKTCKRVENGVSEYFDLDDLITIEPHEYHLIKTNIGSIVLSIINNWT